MKKNVVFINKQDYFWFIDKLSMLLVNTHQFILHAYCLIPNHFHLLIQQNSQIPLNHFMSRLLIGYGKHLNHCYKKRGPIFDGRFKAKLIDTDEYLLQLSKYIHLNPHKHQVANNIATYRFSSYWSYLGGIKEAFVTTNFILDYFSKRIGKKADYQEFVESGFDKSETYQLDALLIE